MAEPIGTYEKQPSEQETLEINFSKRIASIVLSGYVISTVAVTIYDSDGTSVTATMLEGTPSISGSKIYFTVKGGTSGKTCFAKMLATATLTSYPDQILEADLQIDVEEVAL